MASSKPLQKNISFKMKYTLVINITFYPRLYFSGETTFAKDLKYSFGT